MHSRKVAPTILDAMQDDSFFGTWFSGPTWEAWRACLAVIFGLPLSEAQLPLYRQHTGRQTPQAAPAREAWLICF